MLRLAKHLVLWLIALMTVSAAVLYYGTQALLEHYRPQLVAEVSDSVGCPINYSRATIRLTPALEVVLQDVAVMGTSLGFEVTTPYLAAEVKIPELFNKHLDFDKISLLSPSIVLITGATVPYSQQATPPVPATSPLPNSGATQAFPLPRIDSISIDSGRISRRSATGQVTVLLEDLHIESGLAAKGSTITVTPSQASFVLPVGAATKKRLPITASLQQLNYTLSPQALSLQSAQLISGTSAITVSGSMDFASGTVTATAQGSKVGLAPLQQLLGVKALSGTADLQTTVTLNEQTLQIDGTFSLSTAKITPNSGESYTVASLSGPFSLQRAKGAGTTIQSKAVSVQGFSYQDPNVSLNHVNGTLSTIKGTIAEDGAASFGVSVHGTGLDLNAGDLTIKKIGSVDSSLTITVPTTPGYSVSGPVKASGVDTTYFDRPVTGASGSVDMLVSNSVLRFITKGIQAQSSGLPLNITGTVEITDSAYSIPNLVAQVAGGSLASTITIERNPKQQVHAEVLAKELDVAAFKSLVTGDPKATYSGRLDHLSVKATARRGDLLSSATGQGLIEITDGTVARANFDRRVVGLIKAIPVVGEAVSFTSSATDSSTYEMQGGMLKDLTADFTIGANRFSSKNIKAQGKFSNLIASGEVSFHGDLNIAASAIYLEQNLRALAGPLKPLGALFGTIGKIEIPLLITGQVGNPKISADLSRVQDISMPGRVISPLLQGLGSIVDSTPGN